MNKHKWHDVLIAIAEGREFQIYSEQAGQWKDWNPSLKDPISFPKDKYRVKPKETVKRWKWAFKNQWGQNVVTNRVYTEEELIEYLGCDFPVHKKEYCKLEWTLEESEE